MTNMGGAMSSVSCGEMCLKMLDSTMLCIILLQVKERLLDLVLSTDQALEIKNKLNHEIEQGLGKDTHNSASVKCFITYVQDLPNSTGM
jgi:hypothetical protein